MDTTIITQPLTALYDALSKTVNVSEMIVFGSHLEGTATDESDIDVLVISEDFKHMDQFDRLDILYALTRDSAVEIHPWGFTQEELNTASPLTTVGYARDSGFRFLSQMHLSGSPVGQANPLQ
jgi:predicted nucleotidyltransferase